MRITASLRGGSRRGALVVVAAALALAGCENVGLGARPTGNVAEVEVDASGASAANIASLSDVIQRNPNDSVAYNTRGAAYAKTGRYQSAIDDFTRAIQIDPNFVGAYVNRALAYRQTEKDGLALASCARRVTCRRRSPTSTRRSGSIPRARRPFTRAG
jgi:Tfp pilus assembly protein PilF